MAGESFNITDAQEMSIAQPVEAQEALSQEVCDVSASEQQDILKQESQRVADTTKAALPELTISDEQSIEPADNNEMSPASNSESITPAAEQTLVETTGADQSIDTASATTTTEACERQPNPVLAAKDLQGAFEKNFAKLDADSDSFVSEDEINRAVADPCITGTDAQLANALRNNRDELQSLSNDELGFENDGVTRADMAKFNETAAKSYEKMDTDETSLVGGVDGSLFWTHSKIDSANRSLFADSTDPLSSIKPEAVKQGQIGDCYLVSALASVAEQNPQQIKDMIKDNNDGTYTVTFPGAPDEPITVNAPTDAELAQFAEGTKHGVWPSVIEKAYGKYKDDSKTVAQDGIPHGGALTTGLGIMTDKDTDSDVLSLTATDTTREKLISAMQDHRAVTAGTFPSLMDDPTAIPERHAYSVLDFDPQSDMVTIRNPWGTGEPTDEHHAVKDGVNDGIFQMTLEEFDRIFGMTAYVEP